MSAKYQSMDASKAIDFDDRSNPTCNCCSATYGGDAWWKLDLGDIYPINAVIFVGRTDGIYLCKHFILMCFVQIMNVCYFKSVFLLAYTCAAIAAYT